MQLQGLPLDDTVESLDTFYQRIGAAWETIFHAIHNPSHNGKHDRGHSVLAVTHGSVISGILCHCLGLEHDALSLWRTDGGGITVIDFSDLSDPSRVVVRPLLPLFQPCFGGRWA